MSPCHQFIHACEETAEAIDLLVKHTTARVREVSVSTSARDCQSLTHGVAWQATISSAFDAIHSWITTLNSNGNCGELDLAVANVAATELVSQLLYGIEMSQLEVFRVDTNSKPHRRLMQCLRFFPTRHDEAERDFFKQLLAQKHFSTHRGLAADLEQIGEQFENFANREILPHAHDWHLQNALIPDSVVRQLGDLGVFGLTIDESYGGSGAGKLAMCVVTEELSRGYIGVGSLGTRSEIAGELIQLAGSDEQKKRYLPAIASGELLPCAVFTEPASGSDLASLRCRATKNSMGDWSITGNKTWITHASRSDLMTLLVRTDTTTTSHKGLTMLLVEKTRGNDGDMFPDQGMSGSEIEVLGYRGMREYDIAFDHFIAPASATLGDQEGRGFKQLMRTFEAARIQTAARAVGVARSAFEYALRYSQERTQFGLPIQTNQRIYAKLTRMLADIEISRQLTYAAARKKDQGQRCDVEAGMAKLFAAKTAWACADAAVQIHGGLGYSLEHPVSRLLVDARILGIFEGTSEIQSEVIARQLLD